MALLYPLPNFLCSLEGVRNITYVRRDNPHISLFANTSGEKWSKSRWIWGDFNDVEVKVNVGCEKPRK